MSKEAMKLALEDYLSREMPAGTVIGDPKWWAGKIANVLAKQEQGEPVACEYCKRGLKTMCLCGLQKTYATSCKVVHQFRSPRSSDWYDGVPDHHDGHGPYEVRTLYTTPQQRTWVGLTEEDSIKLTKDSEGKSRHWLAWHIEQKLKEKNT